MHNQKPVEEYKMGGDPKTSSKGDLRPRVVVSNRLIRNITVLNVAVQNLEGIEACAINIKLVSTMCQSQRFSNPFCSGVPRHDNM